MQSPKGPDYTYLLVTNLLTSIITSMIITMVTQLFANINRIQNTKCAANILCLHLLLSEGGQWSLIADTQVMSSHSYLDSLLHSQMKVIQVQNYNISDVFSFLIVQIINTELPNTKWAAFPCWIRNAQSFMCSTKLPSTMNWGNKKLC